MILLNSSDKPRRTTAYALVKFFSEFDHAQQFLDGNLFMRRLSYFRREEDAEGRWDSTEGNWAWLQKKGLDIQLNVPTVGSVKITDRDLAAPVSMSLGETRNLYIYCMFAYYIEEPLAGDVYQDIYNEDCLRDIEAAHQVDPRLLRFGPHAVVIPWGLFHDQIKRVARDQSLRLSAGLVRYYDNEIFNGVFKIKDAPFRKQKRFSYQREFRICIQTIDCSPMPRIFKIGPLHGVGRYIRSEDLIGTIKLSLSNKAT